MTTGVRAEVAVHGPSNCPASRVSARRGESVTDVSWTRTDGTFVEEFRVDAEAAGDVDADPVVDLGSDRVYRVEREADATCACEVVEALGQPVADVRVDDGALLLTLHLADVERLPEVVGDLEAVAERVEVRYLAHAAADDETNDWTLVDRGQLTERQREVLTTAHEMGYFEYPREANATEVAKALDIGISTLAEHLAAAQGKLLEEVRAG